MLVNFANSFDTDQAWQNFWPDLDPNCLVFLQDVLEKLILGVKSAENRNSQTKLLCCILARCFGKVDYLGKICREQKFTNKITQHAKWMTNEFAMFTMLSPTGPRRNCLNSSIGRASAFRVGGHGFESRPHHTTGVKNDTTKQLPCWHTHKRGCARKIE